MAKEKSSRRRGGMNVPVSLALPLAAMAYRGGTQIMARDFGGLSRDFTGFDATNNTVHLGNMVPTYGPLLAGLIVHKAASRFGLNQAIGRAKIPFLRI